MAMSKQEQIMVSTVAEIFEGFPPVFDPHAEEPFRCALELTWVALRRENVALRDVAEAALRVWLLLEALRIEGDIGKVLHQDERGFWQVRTLNLESTLRAAGYLKEEVSDGEVAD